MLDVRVSCAKRVDLALIDIEANDFVTDLAISKHQRQADIAQPDNSDFGCLPVELIDQFGIHFMGS